LVFATNQIKLLELIAFGGIRRGGNQPSGNVIAEFFLKRHCGNLRHENYPQSNGLELLNYASLFNQLNKTHCVWWHPPRWTPTEREFKRVFNKSWQS
jgi:hypothetical protein